VADRVPVEPSAAVRQSAKAIHEVFIALANEGFTEAQALHIIGVMLAAQIQGGDSG